MIRVEIQTKVTNELVEVFARLIPQLSSTTPPPGREALQELVDSEASTLFVARDHTDIVGSLTLAMFRIPTGLRAWIEDVVVDNSARGKGVGRLLNETAIRYAFDAGARTVDLTSRPTRAAANHMYQRIGFELRETNVYRCRSQNG